MDETLRQLGGLLLGSIPTIILLVIVYGLYAGLVHRPLTKVLADRHRRTEGAVEKARADIAAAGARTADYEQRLREARLAIFRAQEARRQKALQARTDLVAAARTRAQEQVQNARQAIENDKEAARSGLQAEANSLAAEVIRAVLQPAIAQSRAGGTR
jgi:F-type H+-transporting ATPase subunit b